MTFGLSLCIPTYNRFDTFLKQSLDAYVTYPIIREIIVVDDASNDYDKLIATYGSDHPKIRIFHQEHNVGPFLNKVATLGFASCDWICLIDSDNFVDDRYFQPLLAYWEQHGANPSIIYTPSHALPQFHVPSTSVGTIIDKNGWNTAFTQWWFNLGNCVMHKNIVDIVSDPIHRNHNPHAVDVTYFNWIALKNGFFITFVPDMSYEHRVHDQSTYLMTQSASYSFLSTFNWYIH